VAVCAPPSLHAEVALAALSAGKHVFIEKPLAVSLAQCDQIVDCVARSPHKAMVGFNLRWHRLIRQAREMVQRGALGKLELIRTMFTSGERLRTRSSGETAREQVGVLVDLGVHHFDLWRYLTGAEVEDVSATIGPGDGDGGSAIVTARMQNGIVASSVFSDRTSENNELEIYGSKGSIRVSCYRFDGLEFIPPFDLPGSLRNLPSRMFATLKEIPHAVTGASRGGDFGSTYHGEWLAFAQSIRNDAPVESTVEDGRRAVQVSRAAARSLLESRPVNAADLRSESVR